MSNTSAITMALIRVLTPAPMATESQRYAAFESLNGRPMALTPSAIIREVVDAINSTGATTIPVREVQIP